jgi:hypothetical protein
VVYINSAEMRRQGNHSCVCLLPERPCLPLSGSFGAKFARMKGATRGDKESEKERNDGDPFLDTLGVNKKNA